MDPFMILIWIAFVVSLFFVIFWLLAFLEGSIFVDSDKKIKRHPFVTIAVPAYNEEKIILRNLDSLANLNYPKDRFEIIVVNDNSKDNTKKAVENFIKEHHGCDIILINNRANHGKGYNMNLVLKMAKGEYFVCLDADSWVERDALINMLPYFDNKDIAVVLPLIKIENPKSYLQKLQWCEYLLNFFYKSLMATLDCVHVAPGPFSVYRKKVLQDVGGFAEGNLTEDFEVTLKIQRNHYRIIQLLDTTVYTSSPKTFNAFIKQRNRWYKGTMLNLFDYRDMIFNRKYGDFGVVQLPRVLLSGFLAVFFIGFTSYRYVLKPLYNKILHWSSINFDFSVFLRHLKWEISWIDLNYTNLFFGFVSLTLGLIVIYYAYNFTKEKVFKYGFVSVPLYIVAYGLLASAVWATVFFDLVRGKKQRW